MDEDAEYRVTSPDERLKPIRNIGQQPKFVFGIAFILYFFVTEQAWREIGPEL